MFYHCQGPSVTCRLFHKEGSLLYVDLLEKKEPGFSVFCDDNGKKDPEKIAWYAAWFSAYTQGLPPPQLFFYPVLTPFENKVLSFVQTIPFGRILTYQEVAKEVASKDHARAIGSALGKNPYPLFIPCHRVVAVSGIGGFAFGASLKKKLLDFERSHLF
jgi:methylated-DNA-[protein]-cysteine S-methyltransferase